LFNKSGVKLLKDKESILAFKLMPDADLANDDIW